MSGRCLSPKKKRHKIQVSGSVCNAQGSSLTSVHLLQEGCTAASQCLGSRRKTFSITQREYMRLLNLKGLPGSFYSGQNVCFVKHMKLAGN